MDHSDTLPPDVLTAAGRIYAAETERPDGGDIIEAIARTIMAERERCASIIDAANAHYAEQHELAKNTRPNREVRDLQTMRIATAGLSALIRGGQS